MPEARDPVISMEMMQNVKINGVVLRLTSGACPEQYDAYIGGDKVGYFRLRHGKFYVEYPDVGGETVYKADTKGDGMFEEEERYQHLNAACKALFKRHMGTDI